MGLTTAGKVDAMEGVFDSSVYVALFRGNSELTAGQNGYARSEVTAAQSSVDSSTGVVTFPPNHEIYTGTGTGTAVVATRVAIYDAVTGGNQILEPEDITSPPSAAPVANQAFRMTIRINP